MRVQRTKNAYLDISLIKLASGWRAVVSISISGRRIPSTYLTFIFPTTESEARELFNAAPDILIFIRRFVFGLWHNPQIPLREMSRHKRRGLVCTAHVHLLRIMRGQPQPGKIMVRFFLTNTMHASRGYTVELENIDFGVLEQFLLRAILFSA